MQEIGYSIRVGLSIKLQCYQWKRGCGFVYSTINKKIQKRGCFGCCHWWQWGCKGGSASDVTRRFEYALGLASQLK
eukprot:8949906-Ditylum_brightwellii.AAC.1